MSFAEAFMLLGYMVVSAVGALAALAQDRVNRRAVLQRVLGRVEGRFRDAPWWWPFSDEIEGRHAGRRFTLRMRTRRPLLRLGRPGTGLDFPIELAVELQLAPAIDLRIRRDEGLAAVEKALGLVRDVEVAGGSRFDARYLVEAQNAPARAPLASERVREAVTALLAGCDLDEVRVRDGWLRVRGTPRRMGQGLLHKVLDALEVLAQEYDRRPALEIGVSERFVCVGGPEHLPRCPFCHDALAGGAALVACATCATVLHGECHGENGGCPVLGCGGRVAAEVGEGRGGRRSEGLPPIDLA